MTSLNEMKKMAIIIRRNILRMAIRSGGGHIAPAYSMTDVLTVLFFDDVLKYDPYDAQWENRDFFVLSKGHGALALYAIYNLIGYIPTEEIDNFCRMGGHLGSLAKRNLDYGIESTTGSLGHGLSYAVGLALALKKKGLNNKVYVILGDGECEEGSIWEALMSGAHHKLDNLTVIVDYNKLQGIDTVNNILSLNDLSLKISSFGYDTIDIDGHNFSDIKKALTKNSPKDVPKGIIAHTVKGKGISFMEGEPIWHYRIPDEEELEIALKELGMKKEEIGDYEKCVYRHII